ncbi:MAG: regulatory protein GemA [Betaproteobacteria bacterium]|nr:MAG: regulatory protein GemA [Betaproteobacteria bacterium]
MSQPVRKPASRNGDLAAIHMAQKKLGLSKEDAQALKLGITGKASAADMTVPQRRMLLAHLCTLQAIAGGKPKPAYTGQRRSLERSAADDHDARWGKARALWALLAKSGAVKVDTDAALTGYVFRQTGLEAWRFLNHHQITKVIESLKLWCSREKVVLK